MRKERKTISVSKLQVNTGQIDWLPRNPREWREDDMDRMRKSIREDQDFLEDRPALVLPFKSSFVIFCGNFRTEGARAEGLTDIPCVVYHVEDEDDKMTVIRRAMKDNGSYGKFDWDVLANEWEEFPLEEWGITMFDRSDEAEAGGGGASEHSIQEDDFDENEDGILVRCKKGDIWELGDHRLMCGDSIDLEQVKALMGGGIS